MIIIWKVKIILFLQIKVTRHRKTGIILIVQFGLTINMLTKLICCILNSSNPVTGFGFIIMNSHAVWKTEGILISWLLKQLATVKPADLGIYILVSPAKQE